MASRLLTSSLAGAAMMLTPALAFAHPGHGDAYGLMHGFWHPISGIDHILAMVMVGVAAWQFGGRSVWLLPLTFMAVMCAGGALGMTGIGVPFVEVGIALSVLVLGAVVALDIKAPVAAAAGVIGLFALFHGYAHGAEMPESASGAAYAAGFVAATGLLHMAGVGLGALIGRVGARPGLLMRQAMGGVAVLAGVSLLVGLG